MIGLNLLWALLNGTKPTANTALRTIEEGSARTSSTGEIRTIVT